MKPGYVKRVFQNISPAGQTQSLPVVPSADPGIAGWMALLIVGGIFYATINMDNTDRKRSRR